MYFKMNKACFCTVGLCTTSYISTALVLQFNSLVLYVMLMLCYSTAAFAFYCILGLGLFYETKDHELHVARVGYGL